MATPPEPQDPPADPAPEPTPPADPPAPEPAPADPPKAPEPDDDVIKDRAELARLRRENEDLKAAAKPKAPAPPKKVDKPADPEPPKKRKRRVSRLMGDHYDDDE